LREYDQLIMDLVVPAQSLDLPHMSSQTGSGLT
jgi:hypothetical protein